MTFGAGRDVVGISRGAVSGELMVSDQAARSIGWAVEYHWLDGIRSPAALMAKLVRRRVAVIATPGNTPTLAAKAATTTIPIVFGVGEDPVKLGPVASLARPCGNATGINFFFLEVVAKRCRFRQAHFK
jgi:ABC-type uncharacterized transport system substrate-binding protein